MACMTGVDVVANTRQKRERTESDDSARMQTRGFLFIAAFLVVGFVSLGAFALWRSDGQTKSAKPAAGITEQLEENATSQAGEDDHVEQLLSNMTLEQKVAQLFVITPEAVTGVERAVKAGDATREALTEYPVGGIIYFAQNLVDRSQTMEMLRNTRYYIKDSCGVVPFLCVDEEGGTVTRVASNAAFGQSNVGDMRAIGNKGDAEEARIAARTIGQYLNDLGFNVDFAPVADVDISVDGTMSARSFGSDPALVADMVVAQIDGFTREGVLCAAKHFPGIGGAEGDSHNGRIYSYKTADEMAEIELVPFAAAIKQGVPLIMVGHLSCLELGRGEADLPASLSPAVIDGLLRKDLGYDGVVITDSLQMDAVLDVCDDDQQAVLAIKAGADLVLMPRDFMSAYAGLLTAVREGTITESRIDDSVRRIVRTKLVLPS